MSNISVIRLIFWWKRNLPTFSALKNFIPFPYSPVFEQNNYTQDSQHYLLFIYLFLIYYFFVLASLEDVREEISKTCAHTHSCKKEQRLKSHSDGSQTHTPTQTHAKKLVCHTLCLHLSHFYHLSLNSKRRRYRK